MLSEEHNLLLDLSLNNSERALSAVFKIYSSKIGRYIYTYVKNKETTEELLLDVFYTIWEQRKDLTDIENFSAYIYKIAKFKSFNYLRSKTNHLVNIEDLATDVFIATRTTIEDELISNENVNALNSIINSLPTKCRMAFKLIREDKMSYKDASELLGVSVKTLENHITVANKKIKGYLLRGK